MLHYCQICWIQFAGIGCYWRLDELQRVCAFPLIVTRQVLSLYDLSSLVELIVLNIGLQAGILDTRLFSMFVLHALVLTFMASHFLFPNALRFAYSFA
jgi:hypothetical protein